MSKRFIRHLDPNRLGTRDAVETAIDLSKQNKDASWERMVQLWSKMRVRDSFALDQGDYGTEEKAKSLLPN